MKISCAPENSSWFPNTRESWSSNLPTVSIVRTWGPCCGCIWSTRCTSTKGWLAFTVLEEDFFLNLWTLAWSVSLLTGPPPFEELSDFYWYLHSTRQVNSRFKDFVTPLYLVNESDMLLVICCNSMIFWTWRLVSLVCVSHDRIDLSSQTISWSSSRNLLSFRS
jgi:hypothetical protein